MTIPAPKPGHVVRYDCLWAREAVAGINQGKHRPSCIVVAVELADRSTEVVLVPITHAEPKDETVGVEIPSSVRRLLRLDDQPCWAIVSEYNVDKWPSGLTPLPRKPRDFVYGLMPLTTFAKIRSELARLIEARRAKAVRR